MVCQKQKQKISALKMITAQKLETNACITLQAEQKTCSTAQVLQPIKQKKPTDMQQRSRQMLRVR